MLDHVEADLVISVEETCANEPCGGHLVGKLDGGVAKPLDVYDFDHGIMRHSTHEGTWGKILKRCHSPSRL